MGNYYCYMFLVLIDGHAERCGSSRFVLEMVHGSLSWGRARIVSVWMDVRWSRESGDKTI